jgi:hypothetical protein
LILATTRRKSEQARAREAMKKTSPWTVALAFLVVALPLGWGLYRSIKNSVPLFTAGSPPAIPTAPSK